MRIRIPAPRPPYRIVRSGDRTRIDRVGRTGQAWLRALITLFLAAFAAVPPLVLYEFSDGRVLAALLALPLFTVFPWYPMLAAMAWLVGAALGSYRWIEVDGDRRELRARLDAHFLWGWKTVRIPARDLEVVGVELREPAGDGRPLISVEAEHEGRRFLLLRGTRSTSLTFFSEELSDRTRFFEFAFAVGRALGREGHSVERNDHLAAEVALHRQATGSGIRPVPPARPSGGGRAGSVARAEARPGRGRPADLAASASAEPAGAPEIDLPEFDPDDLPSSGYTVEEWHPGRRVRVIRRGLEGGKLLSAAAAGTLLLNVPILAAGIAFLTGAADAGLFWKLVLLFLFVLVTFLYNAFLLTEGATTREGVFDWTDGTVRLRRNREVRTAPMGRIERFEVRGIERRGGRNSGRTYECRVWTRLPEGRALLLETGARPVRDAVYRPACAMAEQLAGAVGTGWVWRGWESRSVLDAARRTLRRLIGRL